MAALTAGRAGASVIIADEDFLLGGRLRMEQMEIMPRTTIYGSYDHGIFGALERKTDHLKSSGGKPRQVLWRIYTKRSLLAAGSTERSIAFGNNDRPGIMMAGAVRAYANRFDVLTGKEVAIFTNNDDGWRTANDLYAKGARISAILSIQKGVTQFRQ